MRFISASLALHWLFRLAKASDGEHIVLEPVPRYMWDPSVSEFEKRQDPATTAANVSLTDYEQLVWTTPKNHTHPTTVAMTVYTKGAGADRLIIDMGKFAFQLKKARCTSDMMVQFKYKISFDAAKKNWDWVNYNGMRSFVLIADHILCGKDWSLEPWLVSTVTFNATDLTVKMEAEKKTWKKIAQSYAMDFGQNPFNRNNKRFLDVDFDKSFALDLSSDWPEAIITENFEYATFGVTCKDCGTTGSLVFAGHIEGSVFGGIDKFMISATPVGISANLNLEVSFGGSYDFNGGLRKEFDLLTIPLPAGWTIPGVLTFGPNAKVSAGFGLESISGQATISTGVTASIPEDSIAKVDLFAKKTLDIHGWIPEFETKPLEIQAEVTASGEVYTKLAVAVSLEVLDENGVNVDVNLKFPKLKITASGGWNPAGFCPNNANPFGVSLDIWLGAELNLEGYTELDGKRNELFDVDLFVSDELFHFPLICKSFGSQPDGSCSEAIPSEDMEWYENEVAGADTTLRRRSLPMTPAPLAMARSRPSVREIATKTLPSRRHLLEKRADRTYYMECDTKQTRAIKLLNYIGPSEMKKRSQIPTPVPLMVPKLNCGNQDANDCTPDKWEVDDEPNVGVLTGSGWAAEHVYEGYWIKEFLNHIYDRFYAPSGGDDAAKAAACTKVADLFKIGVSSGPMNDLLSQLGTTPTFTQTMTVFRQEENRLKHRLFIESTNIDDDLFTQQNDAAYKSCRFGRVVNACKYMMETRTQEQLMHSLTGFTVGGTAYPGVDGVLKAMDTNADIAKPDGLSSWADEHKSWFIHMYEAGIDKTQKALVAKAKTMQGLSDYKSLPSTTWQELDKIANGAVAPWCNNTLSWS